MLQQGQNFVTISSGNMAVTLLSFTRNAQMIENMYFITWTK